MKYDFATIERTWQDHWQQHATFAACNPGEPGFDPTRPKFYVLDMFPYPSGAGLHVGHPLGYIATDVVARYKRMCGYNVLHPMGFDAFGLPAEQYAVEHGVHPRTTTKRNIENMKRQLKLLGLSYDWNRCLATTDRDYYCWTQWIFLQMYDSWFDQADQKARPIAQLEQMLGAERLYVGPDGELVRPASQGLDPIEGTLIGAIKWHELSSAEQRRVMDRHRLAYMDEVSVNWCPALGTVLANEEVTNEGRSERGNHPVIQRPLRQWMLRITAYADRLEQDLDRVDWPESIRIMQRNWIGRSEGALVDFALLAGDELIRVYTTRPDTLFGATYMVLAPEHPLVDQLTSLACRREVDRYRQQAAGRSDAVRQAQEKTKTGVFTGASAINPANGQAIPVWIADYVLMAYGTGAIMAVPAHDQRDFEFAGQFELPIRAVVMPPRRWLEAHEVTAEAYRADPAALDEAFSGSGHNIDSASDQVQLDGLETGSACARMIEWLASSGMGRPQVQYKLRDWLFSRQRYWGEPFPILHGPGGRVVPVDPSQLPVELPEMADFGPRADDDPQVTPRPPLARAGKSWRIVRRDEAGHGDCTVSYRRELNTMPQWAGSCWYYLRFCDPTCPDRFVGRQAEAYWMGGSDGGLEGGVDLYVGGAEHAVLHLLYARFWHKVLYDLGHVSTIEPFKRLYNQGYIQAHAYRDARGMYVPADQVETTEAGCFFQGQPVHREFGKMGKALKNSVTPDEVCRQYGCDTLRLYEMYLGPLDQSKIWNTRDILGAHRFLNRLWRNVVDDQTGQLLVSERPPGEPLRRLLHRTIQRVSEDIERLSINTAIAALIELNNELVPLKRVPRQVIEPMVLLLSPMAPHICEQLWQMLGHDQSLAGQSWPRYDPELLQAEQLEYPVQVCGRLTSRIMVDADAESGAVEAAALADEKVKAALEGRKVRKVIVVQGRMVNVVAGSS